MNTIILTTGSRGWSDRAAVNTVLTDTFDTFGSFMLMHGANPSGVDSIADTWAFDNKHLGITVEAVPVTSRDWTRLGPSAGLLRNERMVSEVLELVSHGWYAECLAFLRPCAKPGCRRPQPHFTHGGDHCATLAKGQGIPTTIHTEKSFG